MVTTEQVIEAYKKIIGKYERELQTGQQWVHTRMSCSLCELFWCYNFKMCAQNCNGCPNNKHKDWNCNQIPRINKMTRLIDSGSSFGWLSKKEKNEYYSLIRKRVTYLRDEIIRLKIKIKCDATIMRLFGEQI